MHKSKNKTVKGNIIVDNKNPISINKHAKHQDMCNKNLSFFIFKNYTNKAPNTANIAEKRANPQ